MNLRLGAEYNYQMNHKMNAAEDLSGVSVYGSYQMKKVRFIGRYDQSLFSKDRDRNRSMELCKGWSTVHSGC